MLFRESITGTVFVGSLNLLPRIQKHPLKKKKKKHREPMRCLLMMATIVICLSFASQIRSSIFLWESVHLNTTQCMAQEFPTALSIPLDEV